MSEAQACTDPDCRGHHDASERLALAVRLCRDRGVRLTPARRQVLELLWRAARPLGAYDLIDALSAESGKAVAPPTVYRALGFLIAQGLVTKIESLNSYAACVHPERRHNCLFFLCQACGAVRELDDPRIEALLREGAAKLGYRAERHMVEVTGVCNACGSGGAASGQNASAAK